MYNKAVRYIDFMHESRLLWIQIKIDKARAQYESSLAAYEESKKDLIQATKVCAISIVIVAIMITFG